MGPRCPRMTSGGPAPRLQQYVFATRQPFDGLATTRFLPSTPLRQRRAAATRRPVPSSVAASLYATAEEFKPLESDDTRRRQMGLHHPAAAGRPLRRPVASLNEDNNEASKRKASEAPEASAKKRPRRAEAKRPRCAAFKTDPNDDDDDDDDENGNCCICMCKPDEQELATIDGCEHQFCFGCIDKWSTRENTCPLCKNRFSEIEYVHKNDNEVNQNANNCAKKVKNRDQRSDLSAGNALEGLFSKWMWTSNMILFNAAGLTHDIYRFSNLSTGVWIQWRHVGVEFNPSYYNDPSRFRGRRSLWRGRQYFS